MVREHATLLSTHMHMQAQPYNRPLPFRCRASSVDVLSAPFQAAKSPTSDVLNGLDMRSHTQPLAVLRTLHKAVG